MRLRFLLAVFLLAACSSPPQSVPHLSPAAALQSGTALWLALASDTSVPTAGLARIFTTTPNVSPVLANRPSSPDFYLPAPIDLRAYVIAPGTYPALFLITQTADFDTFLLARIASPSSPPELLATAPVYPARTLVAPISAADIPNQTPAVSDPNLVLDFPPLALDAHGYTPALAPDSLPDAYINYATHYAGPSHFAYDDTLIQELLWYDNPTPAFGIVTSGSLVPDLALANYAFVTTTGTLRLFALDETLSARPATGSCLTKRTNSFDIPSGPYSAIDVHLVALVVASEHPNAPTRILTVSIHPLSAIGAPCA